METTVQQPNLAPDNAQVVQNYVLLKDLGSGEISTVFRAQKIEQVDGDGNIVMENETRRYQVA